MKMWIAILGVSLFLWGISFLFICFRFTRFFNNRYNRKKQLLLGFSSGLLFVGGITLFFSFVNAVVCTIYLAMIWAICDMIFAFMQKFLNFNYKYYYAGIMAITLTSLFFAFGWYFNYNVWKTEYNLTTIKGISGLKIVMFSDAHVGTTFDGKEFKKYVKMMQNEKPDIVFVVGDYVDDSTSKQDMIDATKALGEMKTKYGIYFVSGNHDKGYYGSDYRGFSADDLSKELMKNNIKVLRDEVLFFNNSFYVIGRKDYSEDMKLLGNRKSIFELTKSLDKSKYLIVLDHQPVDFDNQRLAQVDLVLSGHTHGGQMFPFNQVGKWIGANDLVYGYQRLDGTDFIVSSGISDWEIKFKTGTKSEFVVVNVK